MSHAEVWQKKSLLVYSAFHRRLMSPQRDEDPDALFTMPPLVWSSVGKIWTWSVARRPGSYCALFRYRFALLALFARTVWPGVTMNGSLTAFASLHLVSFSM
jgi:hypothetical protein